MGASETDFESAFGETQRAIEEKVKTVSEQINLITAADRSRIAMLIIWVFCGAACASILAFATLFFFQSAIAADKGETWLKIAGLIKEVLASVLLPIVTLVIGFYFGVEKVQANAGKGATSS